MGDDRSKGTAVVNLRHPKTVDGEICEQLTMRREIAGDSRDAQRGGGTPAEIEMPLFANLCEVAPGVIEQLGLGNYRQTAGAVPGFFGKLTRVGDEASGSTCPATFTSALAAARPTPRSSSRRSRYAASLSRTISPAAMVSASPGTRRRVGVRPRPRLPAVDPGGCRSEPGADPRQRRPFDVRAVHLAEERREVARLDPHVGRGERPEVLLGGGRQLSRPRRVEHALPAARLDRLPQHGRLPDPGRPCIRRTGPSCRRARPVAGSDPRHPRQGGRRLLAAEGEHPRRRHARHPHQGHDHALRAVRRGRA